MEPWLASRKPQPRPGGPADLAGFGERGSGLGPFLLPERPAMVQRHELHGAIPSSVLFRPPSRKEEKGFELRIAGLPPVIKSLSLLGSEFWINCWRR